MAYPFLPVNPCCTDVVINDPCGCNSVITNNGCNNNNPCSTHLTASSTIVYDGPALSCTTAEPCDTLNVILQKIDEIICNLLTQINYLNNQVINITNQIITINGDIINIYNTLDECCGATTTTTSTTIATPCESFSLDNTGEDPVGVMITNCDTGEQEIIVLLPGVTNICVETDSPLTVPGTVIVTPNGPCGPTTTTTSSTSSTSSTTTTTTTTAYPFACSCLNVSISQIDLDDATGNTIVPGKANNTVYLRASKRSACDGGDIDTDYTIAGDNVFCIDLAVALGNIALFYYKDDVPIYFPTIDSTYTILYSNCSVSGDCDTTTTTTTVEPTTTTTTTCDPGVSHPYYVQPITTTDTFPTEDLSLSGACSNQACLIASSCSVTGYTFNGYMNSSTPTIGDILYQSNIGCTLSGIADGYYALNFEFGGVYTIIQIVNNTIVSLPLCPA